MENQITIAFIKEAEKKINEASLLSELTEFEAGDSVEVRIRMSRSIPAGGWAKIGIFYADGTCKGWRGKAKEIDGQELVVKATIPDLVAVGKAIVYDIDVHDGKGGSVKFMIDKEMFTIIPSMRTALLEGFTIEHGKTIDSLPDSGIVEFSDLTVGSSEEEMEEAILEKTNISKKSWLKSMFG